MWHDFVEKLVNSGAGLGDRLTTSLPRMASISNAGVGEYDGDEVCGASSLRAASGYLASLFKFVLPLGGVSLGAFTHQRRLFFSREQVTLDL